MKIVVKIRGGLGNQLFQYAYAKKMLVEYPEAKIYLDVSYYNKKHIRNLEILNYNLDSRIGIIRHENKIVSLLYLIYRLINKFYLKIFNREFRQPSILMSLGLWFSGKTFKYKKVRIWLNRIYLCGYFQDISEIRGVIDGIQQEISIYKSKKTDLYKKEILKDVNNLGVSIRCGNDYKKFGWPVCTREYYISGVNYMIKKYGSKNIFIFADDINKIIEENWFGVFSDRNIVYVNNLNVTEGLSVLMQCSNFVVSNSTFALWGVILNGHGYTVAPQYFYNNIEMRNSSIALDNVIYLDNYYGKEIATAIRD